MRANANKPERWKADIAQSVDFYNEWFLGFAPKTYRDTRATTTEQVISTLHSTDLLTSLDTSVFRQDPSILATLRMCTLPPLARDRLVGLAGVSPNLVKSMEINHRIPPRMAPKQVEHQLIEIIGILKRLLDADLFPWLGRTESPTEREIERAAMVVADRLCGTVADPVIRNAQEERQLVALQEWLETEGYVLLSETENKVR